VKDSNVIPEAELDARRLKRGDRYPDGRKVPLWGTYSPPPVYGHEPRVVHIRSDSHKPVVRPTEEPGVDCTP